MTTSFINEYSHGKRSLEREKKPLILKPFTVRFDSVSQRIGSGRLEVKMLDFDFPDPKNIISFEIFLITSAPIVNG